MTTKSTPVRDYMTAHPHSIGRDQKISKARELMQRYGIRHLPVLDGGRVVGLLSVRDLTLVETLPDSEPSDITVEEAMTAEAYTVPPTKPLGELAAEMAAQRIDAAIIVESNKVTGVFTTVDALRALSDALK